MENLILGDSMQKAIGSEVDVFLKDDASESPSLYGILIDVTPDSIYLQTHGSVGGGRTYIVPRENIKFLSTDTMPVSNRVLPVGESREEEHESYQKLNVYIDDKHITEITVSGDLDLSKWNEDMAKVVYNDKRVHNVLKNRVQLQIEYFIGEVYIKTRELASHPVSGQGATNTTPSTFVMGGSGSRVATQYLNPSEMVFKLNSIKKGKDNDET
jgi:hypothetical protein